MWLTGDWSIQGGGFFSDVLTDDNFVDWFPASSFYYQNDWRFFLALDHGTSPGVGVVLLMAEARDSTYGADDGTFVRGDLVVVAEMAAVDWQTKKGDGSTVKDICESTLDMIGDWYGGSRYGVADDSIISHNGHPTSLAGEYEKNGLYFEKAGKGQRVPGWDLTKQRLHDSAPNGKRQTPAVYINRRSCPFLIYELQNAISSPTEIGDVHKKISNHALDALRYGIVSRSPGERGGMELYDISEITGRL